MKNDDRLTTWLEIAEYYNVSRHTVMRWHKLCPMPIKKISRTIIATKSGLKRWEPRASRQFSKAS